MFVSSNKLIDLLPYFKRKLKSVYDEREIESIFFLIAENRYQMRKSEIDFSDKRLTESQLLEFRDYVNRLAKNEPVQYILSVADFYGFKLEVTPAVLIPRPETEELVDLVIKKKKSENSLSILDIGTGSGCIAIAVKLHLKNSHVHALDISEEALAIAKRNALLNHVEINFIHADISTDEHILQEPVDILISNPPYIPEADKKQMHQNVLGYEPHLALFVADNDPIFFYRRILDLGINLLRAGGEIYFEIHPEFGSDIVKYALIHGYNHAEIIKDISGKDRFAIIKK